ncbi:hypothetical protein PENNAL_c0411G09824, partial [Penicillium nalgiovense]
MGLEIFAYDIESTMIDTFIHVGHAAHGFALSYFTPAYGRAVDRSP